MNLNQTAQPTSQKLKRDKSGKFVKKQSETSTGLYGAIDTVTSSRLKRRYVNNGYRCDFFIPDVTYTELQILGLKLGVTWDEALRGIIDQHLASSDTVTGLKNFVPALQ